MYKRILVPLDGSDLSERALEPALHIARKFGGEVLMLRVLAAEPVTAAGASSFALGLGGQAEPPEYAEAEQYLFTLQRLWINGPVPITTRVVYGAPPAMILAAAQEDDVDLVVMSTHGRSGLSRFLYGSVAEAVLRGTKLPLLLIPVK